MPKSQWLPGSRAGLSPASLADLHSKVLAYHKLFPLNRILVRPRSSDCLGFWRPRWLLRILTGGEQSWGPLPRCLGFCFGNLSALERLLILLFLFFTMLCFVLRHGFFFSSSVSLQRQSPTHLSFVHFSSKLDLSLGMCLSHINLLQTSRGSSHVEFVSRTPSHPLFCKRKDLFLDDI